MQADPETTTTNGCDCKSQCRASMHDRFKHDWCPTKNNCGRKSFLQGSWDHCLYKDSSRSDHTFDWKTKHNSLWHKVKYGPKKLGTYFVTKTLVESVITSYDNEWDVLPAGRSKTFHSMGAVCPIDIEIRNSQFSGLLQNGKISGIIRLGPSLDLMGHGMMPGASIKFLRTNTTSGNVLLVRGLNPLPRENYNFFSVPLSNHANGGKK